MSLRLKLFLFLAACAGLWLLFPTHALRLYSFFLILCAITSAGKAF